MIDSKGVINLSQMNTSLFEFWHSSSSSSQCFPVHPCSHQVWPITQFFLFPFSKKNHWFAWRANQWPLKGETLFSSVPPSNSLVSVSDLRRAFWVDTAPFSGPQLASCVASETTEIQGQCWVCRARRGGPRTPSTTTDANLDCAFVKNTLSTTDPRFWKINK